MADNVHRKTSHKLSAEGRKPPNTVHKTTSETMRLADPTDRTHQPLSPLASAAVTNNQLNRKKTSSFQITSVTVGSRASNDAGDDSNDDLDESHTEDNSRLTDIDLETPSYSEDTFSKEDVFFNTSNAALSTAPVIPTSSQYGLAIVPSEGANVNNSANENNINTLEIATVDDNNIINLLSSNAKQDTDIREVHSHGVHGRNERFKVVKIESTEPFKRGRWTCMDYLDHTSVNQATAISTPKVSDPNEVCISYGVTDSGIVVPDATKQNIVSDEKPQQVLNVDVNGQVSQNEVHSQQVNVPSNTNFVGNSIGQQVQNTAPSSQYFPASSQPQQQPSGAQGGTMPSNIPTQNMPQSMPQGSIPLMTQSNSSGMTPQRNEESNAYVAAQSQPLQQTNSSSASQPNILVSQPQQQQQSQQMSETIGGMQGMQGMQSIHKVPQSAAPMQSQVIPGAQMQAQQQQQPGSNAQVQMTQVSAGCQNVLSGMQQPQQQQQQGSMTFHKPDSEQDSMSGIIVSGAQQLADATLLESLAEVTQGSDEHNALEDNESMSGTSAVAIDNKIEQAMDLVKSHLMFAVREEVEVLKEKIAELMDRINQLEAENSILKAHATPETLAQLSQATAKLPLSNSGNGQ